MILRTASTNGAPVPALDGAPGIASLTDRYSTYQRLFDSFGRRPGGTITRADLLNRLAEAGLPGDDNRVQDALATAGRDGDQTPGSITPEQFATICQENGGLIARALRGDLAIPDFAGFAAELAEVYQGLLGDDRGAVADYIPQLSNVDPEQLAIAVCTVDGQRFAIGQSEAAFCLQSVSKPINYCLALEEHGAEMVHRYMGREPSGRGFNELSFDSDGLPHNPMINSGGIMSCSLVRPELDMAERFAHVFDTWRQLSGGGRVGFNNVVYLSERRTADRNFALGYSMRESRAFPAGTNLMETLEFYFQCCSIEVDAEALSVVAATLANGGVAPTTGSRLLSTNTVRRCLSLMSSCGMYNYSGEFAFEIGLPAKSGVSGALMIVIPKTMGICIWSPRLDRNGNSVRGIEFCRELVSRYNFHVFDGLVDSECTEKRDPRLKGAQAVISDVQRLCRAAGAGDLDEVRLLVGSGTDPNGSDYDRRTPLHLAAAAGHADVVAYLLAQGADPDPVDRWGNTPLAEAEKAEYTAVISLFRPHTVLRVGKESRAVERSRPVEHPRPADRVSRRAFVSGYTRLLTQAWTSGDLAQRLESQPSAVLAELGLPTVPGAQVTILRTLDTDPDLEAQAALWERGHQTGQYVLYVPFIPQICAAGN